MFQQAKGNYRAIEVEISNFNTESVNIHFPPGGFFYNIDQTEQNLVILFYDKITIPSGSKQDIVITTACANPKRKAPQNGRTTWDYGFDKKGDLILYYHQNRAIVELMTGAEHHDTLKKDIIFYKCVFGFIIMQKSNKS